jgi:hypothetical protein
MMFTNWLDIFILPLAHLVVVNSVGISQKYDKMILFWTISAHTSTSHMSQLKVSIQLRWTKRSWCLCVAFLDYLF